MAIHVPKVGAQNVEITGFAAWPPWETSGQPIKIGTNVVNYDGTSYTLDVEFFYRKIGDMPPGTLFRSDSFPISANGEEDYIFEWDTSTISPPYGIFEIRAKLWVGASLVDEVDMSAINQERVYLTMKGDIGGTIPNPSPYPPVWWGPYPYPFPDFQDNIMDLALYWLFYHPQIYGDTATWPWEPEADLNLDGGIGLPDKTSMGPSNDLDHDGVAAPTPSDLLMLIMAWGSSGSAGEPWNWIVDQNNDEKIDIMDPYQIEINFGTSVPDPPGGTPTPQTTVYVDPPTTSVGRGSTFNVSIMVSNVSKLCAWQAGMVFNPTVLQAIKFEKGPFLDAAGETRWIDARINNTSGEIGFCGHCLVSNATYASGNGTLATVTFNATGIGSSNLDLTDVILVDPNINIIPTNIVNGTTTSLPVHDIAVTDIAPSKTVVSQGYLLDINATIKNQGDYTETFNVTAYANTTVIATFTDITLSSGNSITITFAWNTTGVAKGVYNISAHATPVPFELDTINNNFTDGTVRVAMEGDVAAEFGVVDIFDIVYVAISFGTSVGEPQYNPNADITCDGTIDIFDIVTVAIHFGEKET